MKQTYLNRLIADLEQDEGYRAYPYEDTLGFETVGIGCKLPITQREMRIIEWSGKYPLIKSKAKALCEVRLMRTIEKLYTALFWLSQSPAEVQIVLTNMAYQLGVNGLLKFKKTIKLLECAKYEKASAEMLDSLWAKQTPNRAKRLSDRIKNI